MILFTHHSYEIFPDIVMKASKLYHYYLLIRLSLEVVNSVMVRLYFARYDVDEPPPND